MPFIFFGITDGAVLITRFHTVPYTYFVANLVSRNTSNSPLVQKPLGTSRKIWILPSRSKPLVRSPFSGHFQNVSVQIYSDKIRLVAPALYVSAIVLLTTYHAPNRIGKVVFYVIHLPCARCGFERFTLGCLSTVKLGNITVRNFWDFCGFRGVANVSWTYKDNFPVCSERSMSNTSSFTFHDVSITKDVCREKTNLVPPDE